MTMNQKIKMTKTNESAPTVMQNSYNQFIEEQN